MGIYQYTDPQTGRSYSFEHAGDAPTNEDFAYISNFLQGERAGYAEKYQDVFGKEFEAPDDGTAIGRGYERGKKQIKQAVGETIGTLGEQTGLGFLESYGTGLEERARQEQGLLSLTQPQRMQSSDVTGVGSALTYAGELVGEQIPQLGLGLGAAAAAPFVAGATGLGAAAIGVGAAAATTAPILFGNNIQRQEDEVAEGKKASVDVGDALVATFGQAALEGISDRLLLGGVLKPLGKSITGWKGLLTRTGGRFTGGATTEGLTEVGQQVMERAQAGLPIDSEDAIAEYREAAIAGGLIGGGVRATGIGERGDTIPVIPVAEQTPEQEARTAVEAEAEAVLAAEAEPEAQAGGVTPEDVAAVSDADIAEVTAEPTVEAEVPAAAVVTTPEDPIVRDAVEAAQAKTQEYVSPEPTVTPTGTVTAEMLDDLGVLKPAAMRKGPNTVIGKDLSDPTVQEKLRAYAKNPNTVKRVPDMEARVDALLGGADAGTPRTGDIGTGPEPVGVGGSVPSGAESVGLDGPVRSAAVDTRELAAPDDGGLGDSVPSPELPAVPAEVQPDTVTPEAVAEPEVVADVTPEQVAEIEQTTDAIVTEPVTPVQVPTPAPTQQAPATPAMQQVAIPGQEMGTARQLIPGTKVPVNKQTLQPTGAPQFVEDATLAPAEVAPSRVQGASIPQADLQAADDARDAAAQAQIERIYESDPEPEVVSGVSKEKAVELAEAEAARRAEVREYQDTQLDPRGVAEVTTAVDKEGIVELLNTKDADLDAQGKAAKLYFKRFRRPVDALAEIGATAVIGPTQTIKKDYVQVQTFDKAGRKKGRAPQLAFYQGMTQKSAMDARRWVHANMSDGAIQEMIRARRVANRDTSKFSPSDAYIGVVNAAKSIQQKEDNALKNQLNRYLASPEVNYQAPADLDQSLRTEATGQLVGERTAGPVTKSFKPVKGQTAFESYLASIDFKRRKVRSNETVADDTYTYTDKDKNVFAYEDTRNENQLLTKAEAQEFYDGLTYSQNELGFLLVDPVHGLDMALLPSVRNAVQRGDLQFALNAIASTSQVDRIRQIAGKLAENVGTTQVQVVDDLSQMTGRTAAGLFEPETNTIFVDANNGMNVHTILHEMTHAATSASLARPALPEVKQLQTVFNAVREQLGEVYGTANLDEFVAEAFSNPEFQRALALTRVDGGKMSGWEKFTGAVRRIVRKLLGMQPKGPESALDEVDRIINGMLTPSPATRGAPSMMLMAGAKEGATNLLRNHITAVPLGNKNRYEQIRDFVSANTPRKAKQAVLGLQPVNNLARLAKDKIPFANDLNVLIDQASGALRKAFEPIDVLHNDYRAYKKANRKGYDRLLPLMNRATQDEVDPSRPRNTYAKYWMSYFDMGTEKTVMQSFDTEQDRAAEITRLNDELKQKFGGQGKPRTKAKKAGDPSAEKTAIWDTLNEEYKALGKEGQRLYNVTREMGEAAQDRVIPAIKARISSLGVDAATQQSAFEKLAELLHAQGGVIRPYFKLSRGGDFRLQYNAPDPLRNGGIELFTEYYNTEKDLMQAQQNVAKYLEDIGRGKDVSKIETGMRDAKRNYGNAPSSSFVYDVLQTLNTAGEKLSPEEREAFKKTADRIIDLSLDAIPERSFMQSFRSRKERSDGNRGILGALGDRTPSGMPGVDADPATMFRDNFRGIEKQLVQLEFGAKIQGFRNKLKNGGYFTRIDTRDIADKLDQIASFAQSPSMARWSQIATSMGFGWTMGANISSALNVMFDIPMAVHPYLAGEYGAGKATAALSNAMKLFMGSPSTKLITVMGADGKPEVREVQLGKHNKGFDNHNFDDPNLDPNIAKFKTLVEKAGARGMFNQSIDQEHVDLTDSRDVLAKMNQVSGFLVHHGERFGRQISLMAAYDLELQKRSDGGKKQLTQADFDAAAEKAMDTAELTLGSTASAGRPTWAQGPVGNVAFLFKRFAVSRYYFMAHLLDQSLAGADPETRKIARTQLAYFMATTGMLAGVGGMPLMGAVSAIYDMFADDDEDDFEAVMRKTWGSTIYDGLLNELLGIDVASRVSMNSLLYRQPFIDKDQSALWTLVEQLGGPVVGVGLSVERGYGLVKDGNVRRGLEAMAPAVLRNVSKAERFFREGSANTLRNDPILDDINPYNAFMQGIGFAPADYVENLKINKSERRRQSAVDEKRKKLMRLHNMAKTEGDVEAVRAALEKIRAFNESLPDVDRVDSRIDPADLEKSYKGFVRTTGNMVNGITYTDAMRRSYEEYNR